MRQVGASAWLRDEGVEDGAERAAVEGAHGKENPRGLLCDRPLVETRVTSPRQLPTDDDYDGKPQARSANIRVITVAYPASTAVRSARMGDEAERLSAT